MAGKMTLPQDGPHIGSKSHIWRLSCLSQWCSCRNDIVTMRGQSAEQEGACEGESTWQRAEFLLRAEAETFLWSPCFMPSPKALCWALWQPWGTALSPQHPRPSTGPRDL